MSRSSGTGRCPRAGLLLSVVVGSVAITALPAGDSELVRGDPKQLVLQQAELPVAFAVGGGDYQGDKGYASVFLRPEVLADGDMVDGALLGVMINVELLHDRSAARQSYGSKAKADEVRVSIGRGGGERLSAVDELPVDLGDTDDALLFRVDYELAGVRVIEYRYRVLVANAVTNVIVSGRVGKAGKEPPDLAEQARSIAARQIARIRREGAAGEGS